MSKNWRLQISFVNISNKLLIFISGVILGSLSTSVFKFAPFEKFSPRSKPEIAINETTFDPFADFDLPINDRIKSKIQYYLRPHRRADLLESYQRAGKYLPLIRAIFEEYDLPQVLVYLPIIESRFLPHSRSRAGAVGLWQVMPATAIDYGLKYNRWIDERRDPEKSTIVAAEYLRFLYDEFKNWDLALAAYNYGYPKLKRALRREETTNFWNLQRIPRETYNFVPNFYAILHLLANPQKYGIDLPPVLAPLDYETLDIEATFSIEQLARLANISPKTIKTYNPALIGNIAPSGTYSIRVPKGVKESFLKQYRESPSERVEITYTTYRVKRGDTLSEIARRFGTTVNAIKSDNNLRSTRWIRVGQPLRIASVTVIKESTGEPYLSEIDDDTVNIANPKQTRRVKFIYVVERDDLSLKTLARYYAVTTEKIQSWNPWLQSNSLQKDEELIIYKSIDKITMHKTRRGDSLWRLARKYRTTVGHLKRWNQLRSSRLYPGNNLIVGLD